MNSSYLFAFKDYRAALLAAVFFGCVAPGTKLLSQSLPPQSMAGLLYLFAGLGLLVVLLLRKNLQSSFAHMQRQDYKWFLLATLFGGILGPVFLTFGIQHLRGSSAALFLNLEAVLTALIAWFIFKEHFARKIIYGMLLILLGCLTLTLHATASLTSNSGTDSWVGIVLIGVACLAWAIDNNLTRNIAHLDPVLIATLKGLIAGSCNLFLAYLLGERVSMGIEILHIGILGFLGIGMSLVAFIVSLGKIGTARTAAIFSTAPLIGALGSILFLPETLNFPFTFALLCMTGGLWLHFSEDHSHEHAHAELTHSHQHIHDEHHQHQHLYQHQHPSTHQLANNANAEPHTHLHTHSAMTHSHAHFPDLHHQHEHERR